MPRRPSPLPHAVRSGEDRRWSRSCRPGVRASPAAVVLALVLAACGSPDTPPAGTVAVDPVAVPDTVADCGAFAADGVTASGGDTVPVLRLPCLVGGEDVTMEDLGDRPVVVNLWASWCAPCREEMPLLQDAYERYGDRIGFLGVDTEDPPSAAASLLTDLGVTYASVVDRERRLLDELAAPGLPVTLAVAADGRVLARQVGQMSAERLEELVDELLANGGAPAAAP